MAQLSQEVLKRFKTNDDLTYAIAKGTNRKFETVAKWVRGNDPLSMLTSKAVVLIIKEFTGLNEEQIIKQKKVVA